MFVEKGKPREEKERQHRDEGDGEKKAKKSVCILERDSVSE